MFAVCGAGLGLAALAIAARKRKRTVSSGAPCAALGSPKVTAARELNQGSGMLALFLSMRQRARALQGQFLQQSDVCAACVVKPFARRQSPRHCGCSARIASVASRHFCTAAFVGLVGGGFHIYNVMKREGGFVFKIFSMPPRLVHLML